MFCLDSKQVEIVKFMGTQCCDFMILCANEESRENENAKRDERFVCKLILCSVISDSFTPYETNRRSSYVEPR